MKGKHKKNNKLNIKHFKTNKKNYKKTIKYTSKNTSPEMEKTIIIDTSLINKLAHSMPNNDVIAETTEEENTLNSIENEKVNEEINKKNNGKNTKKAKKNNKKALLIIRIVLIIIIIVCLVYIILWYLENKRSSDLLNEINSSCIVDSTMLDIPSDSDNDTQIKTYILDFENLLKINSSTVGFIQVPNTRN